MDQLDQALALLRLWEAAMEWYSGNLEVTYNGQVEIFKDLTFKAAQGKLDEVAAKRTIRTALYRPHPVPMEPTR